MPHFLTVELLCNDILALQSLGWGNISMIRKSKQSTRDGNDNGTPLIAAQEKDMTVSNRGEPSLIRRLLVDGLLARLEGLTVSVREDARPYALHTKDNSDSDENDDERSTRNSDTNDLRLSEA